MNGFYALFLFHKKATTFVLGGSFNSIKKTTEEVVFIIVDYINSHKTFSTKFVISSSLVLLKSSPME